MNDYNISLDALIKVLDAKTRIKLWSDMTTNIFDGYVYQLYENLEFQRYYVSDLFISYLDGVSAIITKEMFKKID